MQHESPPRTQGRGLRAGAPGRTCRSPLCTGVASRTLKMAARVVAPRRKAARFPGPEGCARLGCSGNESQCPRASQGLPGLGPPERSPRRPSRSGRGWPFPAPRAPVPRTAGSCGLLVVTVIKETTRLTCAAPFDLLGAGLVAARRGLSPQLRPRGERQADAQLVATALAGKGLGAAEGPGMQSGGRAGGAGGEPARGGLSCRVSPPAASAPLPAAARSRSSSADCSGGSSAPRALVAGCSRGGQGSSPSPGLALCCAHSGPETTRWVGRW